jgi:very-short-patch-repair endonuclease
VWGGVRGGGMRRQDLIPIAKRLRKNATEAEKHLWYILRSKSMGVKFRRQAVIGRYVVDFVCFEKRLIIEVDGGQHCQNSKDIIRDQWLKSQGYDVMRFWNNEVLENLDGVFEVLEARLNSPSPSLPTLRGGGY